MRKYLCRELIGKKLKNLILTAGKYLNFNGFVEFEFNGYLEFEF